MQKYFFQGVGLFFAYVFHYIAVFAKFVYKHLKKLFKKLYRIIRRHIRRVKKHMKAGDYSLLFYTVLGVVIFIVLLVLLIHGISGKKKTSTATTTEATSEASTTEEVDPQAVLREQATYIYQNNPDYLMLVNDTNPIPDGYTFEQHTLNSGYIVDERIYNDLLAMLEACNAAGSEYTIKGGYISADTEGSGEYATGLAFDVTAHDVAELDPAVVSQLPTNQWLMQNCSSFGFIVRYPEGKESITGHNFEPWHFRYVGVEAAKDIMASGLTLEEYLGDVQTAASNGRQIAIGRSDNNLTIDGKMTTVSSYNIEGLNYFRLRDLATILADTDAEFNVGYDDSQRLITVESGTPLDGGGSLIQLDRSDIAVKNNMTVMVDGRYVTPTAYNIDGFTYFKLRDLGEILNFGVAWDEASWSMVITTEEAENHSVIDSLLPETTENT